jgi:hypothetical protein
MDDVGDGLHVRYSSIVLEFLLRFLVRIVIYSFFAIFIFIFILEKGVSRDLFLLLPSSLLLARGK